MVARYTRRRNGLQLHLPLAESQDQTVGRSRPGTLSRRGTDGPNPSPSSGEFAKFRSLACSNLAAPRRFRRASSDRGRSRLLSRGTDGSNPSPSSRQSVSRPDQAAAGRKTRGSARVCVAAVGRDAQGLVEIARSGAVISVGRYSSTAVPVMSSGSGRAAIWPKFLLWSISQAKPSRARCSRQASGRREWASSLSGVKSGGWPPSRMACVMSGAT